ncbi:hypothetical protein L6452_27416 [Arctium lappa]|uniref:Uncharacterized protein n=1 Tax=Arctium lappa TaxID=4217 RepID=A0ACB8ZWS0_ARCLA|nr:hypothetical protein L6452_27416 [Arctium lappa]
MRFKTQARKRRRKWDILGLSELKINLKGLAMSSEPASSIQSQDDLDDLRRPAGIPSSVAINSPGQLMPQFWRVVLVIERLTAEWGSSFDENDLLTAYQVKVDGFHRYSMFSKYRGDLTLVFNTAVNDCVRKARYAFVRTTSLGLDSDVPETFWNTSTIKFDEVRPNSDSVYKITRFLGYSLVERSYTPHQPTGDDDEVTIVEPSEVEEDEEEEEEGRREREREEEEEMTEKRKGLSTTGSSVPNRTRMTVLREPSSKGSDASSIATPEKANMGNPIPAVPISVAPPMVNPLEVSNVDQPPLEHATQASGFVPTSNKGKGPANIQTVNFTLPSDFMADDVLDQARIFPHLGKYLLPHFKEKFKAMTIDDVGSNVSGLAFMTFQASLDLYVKMERIRRAVSLALDRGKAALERE